jgi:hypothetical protein
MPAFPWDLQGNELNYIHLHTFLQQLDFNSLVSSANLPKQKETVAATSLL